MFDIHEGWRADERDHHAAFPPQQGLATARRVDRRSSNDTPDVVRPNNRSTKGHSARAFSLQVPRGVPTDEALCAQFERVVVPHLDEAYVLARALTGNGADAQDIVQDASLSAYRAIMSYANGDARMWVLTIVRHAAYQWLRKNRRSALVHLEDLEQIEETLTNSDKWLAETPEAALIAKTDAERLEVAIGAIPMPFRETLILREIRGLDYREIARITGVPIGTVMSRLARARRRLIAEISAGER
jgi:RNA polymerase sigma factor (sigma-70 family)